MLVIISDLHLTDGTAAGTVAPAAFELFAERLQELAIAASWRADGHYRPIDRLDVVLLGDIFDIVRSAQWAGEPGVRPWSNPRSIEFVNRVQSIARQIVDNNADSLAILRAISQRGLAIPPVVRASGRPAVTVETEPVVVRLHYMVGNHDWYFHLPGEEMLPLRRLAIDTMGLANPVELPFPHDMTEGEELLGVMRRHKVTARHGDLYDPVNFEGDRDMASLGDVIVVELINRFAAEVGLQLSGDLPGATLQGMREIDNVRPILLVPVWLDGLLERTCALPSMRKHVKAIWDRMVEEFLAMEFVRRRDTASPMDVVDGLQRALKFSKRMSLGWSSAITGWVNQLRGSRSDSYASHALAEQDFRNRRSRHIVYGHTHAAESVALDASYAEGYVLNQEYFNTGTWRRVHRMTQWAPSEHEFIAQDVMTYAVFYHGDERRGRPYETWSGSLGYSPAMPVVHRVDTPLAAAPVPPAALSQAGTLSPCAANQPAAKQPAAIQPVKPAGARRTENTPHFLLGGEQRLSVSQALRSSPPPQPPQRRPRLE